MREKKIKCSAIVVYYDNPENLLKCIESIKRYCPLGTEIIIVNNSPLSCDTFFNDDGQIKIIDHRCNVGFGRGVNIGLQHINGKYVLILNPDAELTDEFVSESIRFLEKAQNVAAVGPILINPFGVQEESAYLFPSNASFFLDNFKFKILRNRNYNKFKYLIYRGREYYIVDWLCGAAVVFRREALQSVNGFDSNFFMYYEDTDLFKRLKKMGYYSIYTKDFMVKHISRSKDNFCCEKFNSKKRIIDNTESALMYWKKNDKSNLSIIKCIIIINYIFRIFAWLFAFFVKKDIRYYIVSQRIKGYMDSIKLVVFK